MLLRGVHATFKSRPVHHTCIHWRVCSCVQTHLYNIIGHAGACGWCASAPFYVQRIDKAITRKRACFPPVYDIVGSAAAASYGCIAHTTLSVSRRVRTRMCRRDINLQICRVFCIIKRLHWTTDGCTSTRSPHKCARPIGSVFSSLPPSSLRKQLMKNKMLWAMLACLCRAWRRPKTQCA